jgi:hypothetical protein
MLTTASQEAWDRHYPSGEHDGAFIDGARWFAAGMAVCEFLADLAEIHLLSQPTWHCVRRSLTVHAQGCDCEKRVTP